MRFARLASLTVIVLAAGAVSAQEKVDNPEFASWSKFKKGTSITIKTTTSTRGMDTETILTTTLADVGADKVVLESTVTIKFNGMEVKPPPASRDVKKTVELPKGVKNDGAKGLKPKGATEEGTETLKVSGVEVKATWYKVKTDLNGTTTESKVWMSEDVPGTMVKTETTTIGAGAGTTKSEMIEFKKP